MTQKSEALVERGTFAVLSSDPTQIAEALKENLGGEQVGPGDLDRVRIPAGGGKTWTVPTITGEDEAKEIVGIIVAFKTVRSYWEKDYGDGESTPPDCASDDGVVGRGNPGGDCANCPLNQWGSSGKANSNAKACSERRLVFVLREGDMLPIVLSIPPSSIGPFRKYLTRLTSKALPYYSAITKFTLRAEKNKGSIPYSEVVAEMVSEITGEQAAAIKSYANTIKPLLSRIRDDRAEAA